MNEIIITQETMSSLQIAELTGKQHAHIMRDIRTLLDQGVGESNFGLSSYKSEQNKDLPCYNLTKKGCLILASGYDAKLRERIIDRWEQLEIESRQRNLPSYQLSDPIERAQKWIQEEQHRQQLAIEVKAKEEIIEQQRPKVLFAECITSSPSNILIADLAKLLTQNGITIGQNRLFDWLTDKGYLLRKQRWSNSKNAYKNEYRPSQRAMELGILSMSEHAIPNPRTGEHFTKFTCYVTGKGQQYFINKFKADSCLLAI